MMDTVHDIGGRQGFGPINWQKDRDERAFREEWQGRAWALCMCMFAGWRGKPEIWTLDWFRHVRERIEPIDYLTRNYFDQWLQSLAATMIDNGAIRLVELVPAARIDKSAKQAQYNTSGAASSSGGSDTPGSEGQSSLPLYANGDTVRMKMLMAASHTRLPAYVRGRVGVVEDSHGPRPLADASALGVIKPEPLYTIAFEAADLWPEAKGHRERVFIDAWESYLERA
jgi:nitrile hydratase subunit beta